LCFFVFVHARVAIQTIDSTVLVHVLANIAFYTGFVARCVLMLSFVTFFARFFFEHSFFVGILARGTIVAPINIGHTFDGRVGARRAIHAIVFFF
jgi:hypothetical protein